MYAATLERARMNVQDELDNLLDRLADDDTLTTADLVLVCRDLAYLNAALEVIHTYNLPRARP